MRPSKLGKSLWRRGILIKAVLAVMAPLAACTTGSLLLSGSDLGASADVAEIRVLPGPGSAAIEQELHGADHALLQAIATNDRLAAARLLDSEFTWIDRDGRRRSKSELLDWIGLLSAGPDADFTLRAYGRVALITGTHRLTPDNVPALFARVWVRQPSGWRLLLYQETAAADFAVENVSYGVTRAQLPTDCDNPCRTLPYKSLSSDAQEIVASFMAGEKAVFDGDAEAADRILGDDVLFVTPDGAQPMNKEERMAALRTLRHAGQVDLPPAVASMALWVFGNAAVMSADQESPAGELLRATRIWAKRDGRWQLAYSQQTLAQ